MAGNRHFCQRNVFHSTNHIGGRIFYGNEKPICYLASFVEGFTFFAVVLNGKVEQDSLSMKKNNENATEKYLQIIITQNSYHF